MDIPVQIVDIEFAKRIADIMGPSSAHAEALAEIERRSSEDLVIVKPSNDRHTILVVERGSLIMPSVSAQTPWTEHTDPG